jgi:putative sigma-54 modulation protein
MDNPIQITFRHGDITDALRNAVNEHFHKLERHFGNITHMHVTLSVSKVDRTKPKVDKRQFHKAKALVLLPGGHEIIAEESSDNMYTSIDVLAKTMDHLVIEAKRKMQS